MAGLIPGPTSFNGSPDDQQLALYSDVYLGIDLYEIIDKRHPSHARNIDG
jgi:hypothetical protein